jgi:S-adenosylmethionine synthetase
MNQRYFLRTAECVSPKHPDKLCDQISDAILDECLRQDQDSRVAIETMGGHGKIYVCGELTTHADVDIKRIVHQILETDKIGVIENIVQQSPEIARGVDDGGAGDQGIMKGYACNENDSLMPLEYYYARELCKEIFKKYPYDGKTQITICNKNVIRSVVASFQNVSAQELKQIILKWLNKDSQEWTHCIDSVFCNPGGDWNIGGFDADTGLTGRKLMVDNYGPRVSIGGGAFSGKDATKVDRSAAYMARRIAVILLKIYGADEVYVDLAYSIGIAEPIQAIAKIYKDEELTINDRINELFDLTPRGIIDYLKLKKPIFQETAKWGHFGNGFSWDKKTLM